MDASTLIIVFLLVTLASLASYLLSQWSFVRNGGMNLGWVAIGTGTILLLAAAVIVVLTADLLPTLRLWPNDEAAKPMSTSVQFGGGIEARAPGAHEVPTGAANATTRPVAVTDRDVSTSDRYTAESRSEHRSKIETAPSSPQAGSSAAPRSVGLVFSEADPWAATKCVVAFNPDPADLTRWTMENDCGAPVAVLVASSCSKSPSECNERRSASWDYPIDGMIFPGKAQRFVTHDEETVYGSEIRYVACMVATPLAIKLIGQSSEAQASPGWLEQFNAARSSDPCLMRVQQWSGAGRASGKSLDVLLGAEAPVRTRPRVTSEP